MSIEGALLNAWRGALEHIADPSKERECGLLGYSHDTGKEMTEEEAFSALLDELKKGRRVLPLAPCDGFDYETGCPGHSAVPA